jgi:hypothetical protein
MRTAASASSPFSEGCPSGAELVRLRDGSSVTVRQASGEDEPALLAFLSGLCLEAQRLRFFTGAANLAYAAGLGFECSTGAPVSQRHLLT